MNMQWLLKCHSQMETDTLILAHECSRDLKKTFYQLKSLN